MTIKECIDAVDNIKPNQYSIKEKVQWLSFIDEIIINDVLKTHEGYDGRYDNFEGYTEDRLSETLIVGSPYDRLYTAYLKMKIDGENGEMAKYNNSAAMFNAYLMEYRKHYNKTHMPLDVTKSNPQSPQNKKPSNIPDAVYENIKRELYALLSENFADMVSDDKIYDIVMRFVNNNIELLKGKDGQDGVDGKDGYTPQKNIDYFDGKKGDKGDKGNAPQKGIDYWTEEDKAEFTKYIDEQTSVLKSEIKGIQEDMQNEAHFRGYLSTNEKIQSLAATPNDFAYSAESGTKWIYDEVEGWQDSGTSVPDQLTPASNTTPLINGEASAGKETSYARGDHRHPTDTTRASAEELNDLKDTKADKTQIIRNISTAYNFTFSNNHNSEVRLGEMTSISFTFGDGEYAKDYTSGLSFDSGATPTAIDYTDSGILNWVGTDCTKSDGLSIFQPSANTHYDIVFYFNGVQFIGLVNGFVPATGNEAV